MAGFNYQILIGAALGAGYQSTIGQAMGGAASLGKAMEAAAQRAADLDRETAKLENARRAGEAWRSAGRGVLDANTALTAAKSRLAELTCEVPRNADAVRTHTFELNKQRTAVKMAAKDLEDQRNTLRRAGEAAAKAGFDTRNYTGEQRRLGDALRNVEVRAKATAAEIEKLRAKEKAGAGLGEAWSRLSGGGIGTAAAGLGLGVAINGALNFEATLVDIGITADMNDAKLQKLRATLIALGRDTGQSKEQLAEAFRTLVSAGLSADLAEASLASIGRAATASGAAIEDISNTAFQLINTLGVKPEGLAAELDRLALAGKAGSFELKDMAKALPSVAAAAQALKLQGAEAVSTLGAAFQIAKLGAADASQAANNFQNFLTKAVSPETIRNFAEFGVNIPRVIDKAIKEGGNPFEALIGATDKLLSRARTDGQKAEMIGKLFGDMQVQAFIRPMLQNLDKYKQMKAEFDAADGQTIQNDFARRLEGNAGAAQQARLAIGELAGAVGNAFLPALGAAARALTPVFQGLAAFSEVMPATTAVALGGAVAFRVLGTALMANPIGATVSAIALGAALLIDNWSTVKDFFVSFWEPIGAAWEKAEAMIGGVWAKIEKPFNAVRGWFGGKADAAATAATEAEQSVAASRQREISANVNVNFANAPRGMRVTPGEASPGLDLGTYTGYAMAGAP